MITVWSRGVADDNMPEQMLLDTIEKVRGHPWYVARAKLVLATLKRHGVAAPARIMDVGCGWGVTLEMLEGAGYTAYGLDISRQILERIDRPNRHLIEADLNQTLPPEAGLSDALLSLDVLEHLDDDSGAIQRMAPLLRPGGVAVISVPALPDLFAEFDRIQGHRRRYLPDRLRAAFADSGLEVQEIFWWGAWMVPILRRTRKGAGSSSKTYADYLRLPPWPMPYLMKLAYAWEHSRALNGKLRTGTSLFAVATRAANITANP
jgi:2-polyprenyl-3-methyl-5-hydroxy-6-metoxy-1,4-benzoquinol methylase